MQGDDDFWESWRKSASLPIPETTKLTFKQLHKTNKKTAPSNICVALGNTLDSATYYRHVFPSASIVVHNFANGFAPCADACVGETQEEFLVRRTNVLRGLHRDLYPLKKDVLLSKNVRLLQHPMRVDVISSAALDTPVLQDGRWVRGDYEHTRQTMATTLLASNTYDIFITGAWGCGLFRNPIEEMCNLWNELIPLYGGKKIVFAIPDRKTYDIFEHYIV